MGMDTAGVTINGAPLSSKEVTTNAFVKNVLYRP